jgi:membrane-bound ClpP family serine protease
MSWLLIIILILVGLLMLTLEILVVPGFIVGVIGFGLICFGVYNAYNNYGTFAGNITLVSTLILTLLTLIFILRSKTWNKLKLNTQNLGRVNVINEDIVKVGDIGKTISRLAPAGKAEFHGEFFEVHTYGEFIDPQKEINITKISENKIFVKLNQ